MCVCMCACVCVYQHNTYKQDEYLEYQRSITPFSDETKNGTVGGKMHFSASGPVCVSVSVCVRACVRACVYMHACCVCVYACALPVCMRMCVCMCMYVKTGGVMRHI